MIRAIDLGFGAVKGIYSAREVEYPSAVGSFRPIRFTTGMENIAMKEGLCVEYEGSKYFIGDIAYTQSSPRVTMNSERFTSKEGLALMMATLVLLSNQQHEKLKLITGLPVDMYTGLKDKYKSALLGQHYIQLINPDGSGGQFYSFYIDEVSLLPQPIGTIFDKVLNDIGEIANQKLGSGRIAVLDIGKHTVDLSVTDQLRFVDKSSISFSDVGIFDAYRELSLALKEKGFDIPADSLEPFIRNGKSLNGLEGLKEKVFASQAEKILSRVINTWADIWSFDRIYITGGGALLLSKHLISGLDNDNVEICKEPTFTNCRGYYKFANKMWG